MRRTALLTASAALVCGSGGLVALAAPASAAGWRNIASRAIAYEGALDKVDVVDKKTAWAIGSTGGWVNKKAVIVRWRGAGWVRQAGPFGFTPTDIAGATPKKAWAVGFKIPGGPVAVHWNGTKWITVGYPRVGVPSQVAAAPDGTAYSVAGIDSSGGGISAVTRWNGHNFVQVNLDRILPPSTSITAVDVRGKNNVWLAGTTTADGRQVTGLVLHYNGKTWRRIPIPGSMGTPGLQAVLHKMVVVGPNRVLVSRAAQQAQISNALLIWNGQSWRTIRTPLNAIGVGIAPDGAGGAWLTSAANGTQALYFHWTGGRWVTLKGPKRPGRVQVGDIDQIPGTRGAFSVGSFPRKNKSVPFIERY